MSQKREITGMIEIVGFTRFYGYHGSWNLFLPCFLDIGKLNRWDYLRRAWDVVDNNGELGWRRNSSAWHTRVKMDGWFRL